MNLRRWVGMAVLLAGAASTAAAQELRIESFTRDGTITFNQTAGAGEYHLERWLEPGWAHLFTKSAPGIGIVTGVVSLAEPSEIIRVRAGRPDEYLVIDLAGGADATNYPVSTLAAVPSGGWMEEHRTTKLVLRRIPAGVFTMGSPSGELGRDSDETQHQVTLTKDFYIGVFEVTQEQWYRVMGDWPSYFNNVTYRDSRPVERVSYNDIRGSSAGAGWPGSAAVDAASFIVSGNGGGPGRCGVGVVPRGTGRELAQPRAELSFRDSALDPPVERGRQPRLPRRQDPAVTGRSRRIGAVEPAGGVDLSARAGARRRRRMAATA
jgi:hypothetical protein